MRRKMVLAAVLVLAAAVVAAFTVPITVGGKGGPPKPGSADYTEPLASSAIPPVPPKFGGEIKPVEKESKAWWPPRVVPPKGAPNVLLIMTDDVGFGAPSTFGGVIPTPALDRIAQAGPALHAASTPPRSARRRAPRSSPGATTTRPASA